MKATPIVPSRSTGADGPAFPEVAGVAIHLYRACRGKKVGGRSPTITDIKLGAGAFVQAKPTIRKPSLQEFT